MNRTITPVKVGDHNTGRTRYRLRIEDDPSGPAPADIQRRQLAFLQAIVDQPMLLACGPVYADRFSVFHDGDRWILQAEAESDDA